LDKRITHWSIFLLLSLTWGSSFILMKIGMEGLQSYQVASVRLVAAGLTLLPFFFKYIRETPLNKLPYILLSGLLGNGIPAFLFCLAETRIDSALAGILNSFTPLMALIAGTLIFKSPFEKRQLSGICVGLVGVIGLFVAKGVSAGYWYYGFYVLLATVCYGINIALVHHYLKGFSSIQLSSIALAFCAVLALPVLICSHFFPLFAGQGAPWIPLAASATLGIFGSGIATVLFYILIQRAGSVFASMVTYALPVVAIGWGLLAGENITLLQVVFMGVILAGVYMVHKK